MGASAGSIPSAESRGSSRRRFGADLILGTLDQGAASVLGLAFHILAARVYSASTYGWLVMVWSTVAFGVLLWRAALGVPFVVEYSESRARPGPDPFGSLWSLSRRVQGVFLLSCSMFLALMLGVVRAGDSPLVLMASGGLLLAALLERELWRHRLIADLHTTRLGVLGVVANFGAAGCFAVATVVFGFSAYTAIFVLALAVVFGTTLVRPGEKAIGVPEALWDVTRRWWRFGRHILLGVVCTTGASQLVLWLLLVFRGDSVVGTFGAVFALAGLPRPAINAVTAILTPSVARSATRDQHGRLGRLSLLGAVTVTGVVFVTAGVLVGPDLMTLLFPTVQMVEMEVIIVLSLVVTLEGGNAALRGIFRGAGRPDQEARSAIAGATAGVLAAAVLIPLFGILGAALSLLATQAAFFTWALSMGHLSSRPVQTGGQ